MSIEKRKQLFLQGLDCANCALKIEKEINVMPEVKTAEVHFASQTLIIEPNPSQSIIQVVELVKQKIQHVESRIQVIEVEKSKQPPVTRISRSYHYIQIGISALLFLVALLIPFSFWVDGTLYLLSYVLVGRNVLLKAARNLVRGRVMDENFLMSIATLGAFMIQQFPEGVAVMLFYQVGELLQEIAVHRSRKSIAGLMDIRPDYARVQKEGAWQTVSPDELIVGDTILVQPGEKIPIDGKVVSGKSMIDTSALTGESLLREVTVGCEVLSGTINIQGVLTVTVTQTFGESTVSKILELVQRASSNKALTEHFITKFAKWYTPIVVCIALVCAVVPPLLLPGATFSDWMYRALVFLVISCPCALVISIPLGFFGGIGGASRRGILIKGGNYLEALTQVETVIWDKTGTLTQGVFQVTKVNEIHTHAGIGLLEWAAYAESYSHHPIATSIVKAYAKEMDSRHITDYQEITGAGIRAKVRGKLVLAGNARLMHEANIPCVPVDEIGTVVYIAVDHQYLGYIVISDEIKSESALTIQELKKIGVKKVIMMTGDLQVVADRVGQAIGVDEVYAELLPHQKVEILEKLDSAKSKSSKIVFVGDGMNDAPVLARADIGIAMGGIGSDAAIEAADVVLMTDEPMKMVQAIQLARRTRQIVWQNILLALVVKGLVLVLGAGGMATIWEAVFADVGVTLLAVVNAMRVLKSHY